MTLFYRCATETNIWKRLKRIVELKKDHETARKEMEKKQIGSAINFLSDLIEEWDTIIYRYIFTKVSFFGQCSKMQLIPL